MIEFMGMPQEHVVLLREENHLCCYDPAMWLSKGTVSSLVNLIGGDDTLLNFWFDKPIGNGPWSWPLKSLTSQQENILKERYWKIRNVFMYKINNDYDPHWFINNTNLIVNYIEAERVLFVYMPSKENYQISYFVDDIKSVNEFYEVIEEYFGRYIVFDVEKDSVYLSGCGGPYGSYTMAYEHLGRKGCRNYLCVYKCPVFPVDDYIKNLTTRIELIVEGLTSEVKEIKIFDIDNKVLAHLNEEGEFEITSSDS